MDYQKYKSPSFFEAYINAFKFCYDFKGRSRRAEYWKFIGIFYLLFFILVTLLPDMYDSEYKRSFIWGLVVLVIFLLTHLLPVLSVTARRLHDSGQTSKWIIGLFIPYINFVFYIFISLFAFMDSEEEEKNWGESSKYYIENDD